MTEDKLQEIDPPTGFILSDEVVDVSITTDNKTTAVIDRTNVGNEMVLKKTDLTNGKAVAGATIVIYDESGDVFFEGKTDENGEIVLKEVPAGKYTYKETIAPSGFALNTETFSFEMDVYGKVTGKTEITNEPIAFMLNKVNTFTNKPFANIEFTLKDAEGNVVKTKMTEDGYRVAAEDGSETFLCDCAANIACLRYGIEPRLPDAISEEYTSLDNRDKRDALSIIRDTACDMVERIDHNLQAERNKNEPER